jgi:hypothetical protein
MKINYNQLDKSNKSFYIVEGIYPIESDKNSTWIWTSTAVFGIVSNVRYISIQATSEIDNILTYDGADMDIKSNCLNIIKLDTADKNEFQFSLKNVFNVPTDDRNLGIMIKGIIVDGEKIY